MKSLFAVIPLAALLAGCSSAPPPAPAADTPGVGSIVRLDPAFDSLVPKDAHIEKVAGGFQFTEGPLWRPEGRPLVQRCVGQRGSLRDAAGQVKVLIPKAGGKATPPLGRSSAPTA